MYEDEGFYFQQDQTPPALCNQSAKNSKRTFPGKCIKRKGAIDRPAPSPVIWHQWIFSVVVVKYIVYARNPAIMIKMVYKRCLYFVNS